ncbi:MAG: Mrp/NBP35 family ATP-binding protein [Coriobacteriales bacterium]|jgi:Mrp family chromosome partitioning ATPase|nr:Mrp/NBP35 family ATP-binding protein [Coriobacteriales bacterium]
MGDDGACPQCDSACSSCDADCADRSEPAVAEPKRLSPHASARIGSVIAVVSGKGGVGKSLVASLFALCLRRAGHSVGILDADVTGPSIPHAFGVRDKLRACADGIIPAHTTEGIQVVSTNLVLPEETTPVLWRGTIISGLVRQFFSEVLWGDLDYLVVDMPPGTGDVSLTVYQSLPVDGIVVVTAPQGLVSMIVGKAINMAAMMEVPVLGLVENMSYARCPECGARHEPFGESDTQALARSHGIELTAQLPLSAQFAARMDAGEAESIDLDELVGFKEFTIGVVAKAGR